MPDDPLPLRLYRSLSPAFVAALPLASPWSAKLREGLAGRRGLAARLAQAAPRLQGCVWFHVASVGEYEQARPVIAALRELPQPPPVAVTHFSPSGYHFAARRPCADFHDYLPFDHPGAMRDLVSAWRPRALVFVKFDCWPNQTAAAAAGGARVLLLAGTLQPRSARLRPPARGFFRALFDRFAHLGVCTEQDRQRFVAGLGVRAPVSVTGDTRAEQVILRYESAAAGAAAARLARLGDARLILGSTWPPDEALWLPVLPELLRRFPGLRLVLAPHEPTPARLSALEGRLGRAGIASLRLGALLAGEAGPSPPAEQPRCVLVDSVGLLAEIYRAGTLAYVGGSFTTGVHNTMEPAIAGLPVLFGPVIQNAAEAARLVDAGAGWVVRRPADAAARAAWLLAAPTDRAAAGRAARAVVLAQRGATEKSLALLRACI